MTSTILITDTLFITPHDEIKLINKGYTIERIDNPCLTEDELCATIKGKRGYILGGEELCTERVIKEADMLEAISFTGTDYKQFIPGYKEALKRGIRISHTPAVNADAVAEYTLTLMMMMNRSVLNTTSQALIPLKNKTIGIIGMGAIGTLVTYYLKNLGVKDVIYYSRTRKIDIENGYNIRYVERNELIKTADIITFHIPKENGNGYINASDIASMKDNTILINAAYEELIDMNALYKRLLDGTLRAAYDRYTGTLSTDLDTNTFFYNTTSKAYNTTIAIQAVNDIAVESMIDMLSKQHNSFCVNNE